MCFAGVMLHTEDHHLQPLDKSKGPDFVIYLESNYSKKNDQNADTYKRIKGSDKYLHCKESLKMNHGSFEYQDGIPESPWRIIVLRKSLLDILRNTYTLEEQKNAVQDAIKEGLNLLVANYK